MDITYYLYYLYYTFLGYPFIIRVIVFFDYIFIFILILTIITMIISKQRSYQRIKWLKEKLDKKYTNPIVNIITSQKDYTSDEIAATLHCNVKKLSYPEKRILTNMLFHISEHESPVNPKNYQNLIVYFNLLQFWEKELKFGNTVAKARALRKLDDIKMEVPGSIIASLAFNRNPYLRKKARASHIYYSKVNPFKFFDEDFDKTMNDWDKIEIHRMLARRQNKGLPIFTQWIKNSNNSNFRCFLVNEIKLFNQKEAAPFLTEIMDTHDVMLRKESIDALGELGYQEAEEWMIKDFMIQPLSVQHSIIRAIQKLYTGNALPFLEDAYHSAHDSESKILITKAIFNYGDAGKEVFYRLKEGTKGFSRIIFEHVSNPLIKNN